jgi:flagellin
LKHIQPFKFEEKSMTSINAGGAFYRVQAALDKNSMRVADSMQRLATGQQNISPGDNAGTVALSTGLRAELATLQIGVRNASEVLNALEMVTNDIQILSDLVIRLEELNALGENALNSAVDRLAIKAEATAIIQEFDLVQRRSQWKGNNMFQIGAGTQAVSFGRNNGGLQVKALGSSSSIGAGVTNNLTVGSLVTFGSSAKTRTTPHSVTGAFTVAANSSQGIGAIVTASLIALGTADGTTAAIRLSTGLGGLAKLVDEKRVTAANIYNQVENSMNHLGNLKAGLNLDIASKTDVDFAAETTELAKGQILAQAGTAMLAQANAQGQSMLALIQS